MQNEVKKIVKGYSVSKVQSWDLNFSSWIGVCVCKYYVLQKKW